MRRVLVVVGAVAVGVVAVGCDRGPRVVPASGVVLVDGRPLTAGTVQVMPAGARAASGKIGADGRFTLTTDKDDDGCVTGTHPVRVVANENVGSSDIRWLAPKKYADPAEAKLTITIDGPTNDLKIDLTWAGGQPFVEKGSGSGKE